MGSRARARARIAKAKRAEIVAVNLSQPKPQATGILYRAKTGEIGVIRAPATSSDYRDRLEGGTMTPGFRDSLRGGNPEDRPFIASRGVRNAAADIAPTFNRDPETPRPRGPNGAKDKPFSKMTALERASREASREQRRQAEVDAAFKATKRLFKKEGWHKR